MLVKRRENLVAVTSHTHDGLRCMQTTKTNASNYDRPAMLVGPAGAGLVVIAAHDRADCPERVVLDLEATAQLLLWPSGRPKRLWPSARNELFLCWTN